MALQRDVKMLAAILKAPGLFKLEEIPDAECPKGGALLEVRACAVCGTDIKMLQQGHKDLVYPRVLGHEIVGRIVEIDSDSSLVEGDSVQVWPGIACGQCGPCLRGANNRCSKIKIMGFNCDGGFAELLAIPGQIPPGSINLLHGSADPAIVALAEPLACCINGQEKACISKGDSVLIYGGGPIGALHVLLAELKEAANIIVVEKLPGRITKLQRHTQAIVIDQENESLEGVLAGEIGDAAVDVIITATPEVRVDAGLQRLLAPGGRICIFSGPRLVNYLEQIDLRSIHYHEQTITGSYGCSSHHNRLAVELLTSGVINASWIVTKRTNLKGIEDAFSHSSQRIGLKSVICEV